jgi:alkylation response protein AidB-like acyl-CoA dehydrogenase
LKDKDDMTLATSAVRGGSWLLDRPVGAFTPERMTEDHRLIAKTTAEFAENEVVPAIEALERKDWERARALLRRCGELGLLGVNVPEAYGGVELDKVSSLIVSEHVARSASFGATYGAQANLCILPILMFGTDEQKARYLPRLVTGELVGAYALSEAGSGSDALSAHARAVRQPDGGFRLSGEKMWITNGGFADIIIVFAKVDGEHFSAFVVERGFGGVTSGHEERKMGLHGSSTTPVVLQEVPVPAANLLGEVGRGHKVAFNVLNFGRFKLGAMCLGGCRLGIGESAKYAATRRQFGHPIAHFGAIKHKLGEMTARTYALEALMFRTAGLIDDHMTASAEPRSQALLSALEEFAVEASIAKVVGSETLDYVLDENVQIHGGNGFVSDYPAERHYRDARVNRIFEGTNEINRLLIPGLLVKRALKGDLGLIPAARRLLDEVMSVAPPAGLEVDGRLGAEQRAVEAFKKVTLLGFGAAMQRFGHTLVEEQEVLLWLADLTMETFAAESAVIRATQAGAAGSPHADLQEAAAASFVSDAALRVDSIARQLLAAIAEGDALRTNLAALRRLLKVTPAATVALRRRLADATVARGAYLFR